MPCPNRHLYMKFWWGSVTCWQMFPWSESQMVLELRSLNQKCVLMFDESLTDFTEINICNIWIWSLTHAADWIVGLALVLLVLWGFNFSYCVIEMSQLPNLPLHFLSFVFLFLIFCLILIDFSDFGWASLLLIYLLSCLMAPCHFFFIFLLSSC